MRKKKKLTKWGRRLFYLLLFLSALLSTMSIYSIVSHSNAYKEAEAVYTEIRQEQVFNVEENMHDAYIKKNEDYVGWIKMEESAIDYPIVQGKDNTYYLEHLFDGKENHMGSIFMDYENSKDFEDKITFLYGHHTNNGSMFYELENFKKQEYYNNHKSFFLKTKKQDYILKPFSGVLFQGRDPFIQLNFKDDTSFMNYVIQVRKNSVFESPVTVKPSDKLVALVTCTDDFYDARLVLYCVLETENSEI